MYWVYKFTSLNLRLKRVVTDCRPNEIHDLAEQQDIAREKSDAISHPVGFGGEFDEVIVTEEKYNTLTSYIVKKSPKS